MSPNHSISETSKLRNFLISLSFAFYFSKPALRHIEEFIIGAVQFGYRGKVMDLVTLSHAVCHRTTYGKFLSQGAWNEEYVWRSIRKQSVQLVYQEARKHGVPLFVIHDDTIAEKTKPSSQAKSPIEKAQFHQSHLDHRKVWGHQLLTTMLSCNGKLVPYVMERYERERESKIDIVCRIVESLPVATGATYGLCDSWFTCQRVIEAHWKRGFHVIGGLKTNRVIYPKGVRIQIKEFAQYIKKTDVHLVTVGRKAYWVYRHEGALNGVDDAVVVLCWPKNAFHKPGCLHAFLSTDTELTTQTLLEYYSQRWPIEIFFRQSKGNFGLNTYQVRSAQAIDRILALIALTYLYCVIGTGSYCPLGRRLKEVRASSQRDKVAMIYNAAKNNVPLTEIFLKLKIA